MQITIEKSMRFDELPLCDAVLDGLQAMNFKEATPVQAETIPVILEKRDVIACAQTGTGKQQLSFYLCYTICNRNHMQKTK
jgi:superfamily II DNA/RNA helicase